MSLERARSVLLTQFSRQNVDCADEDAGRPLEVRLIDSGMTIDELKVPLYMSWPRSFFTTHTFKSQVTS